MHLAVGVGPRQAFGHASLAFGDRPLGTIRPGDVQAFVAGLTLAPSTVRLVHQHLAALLDAAVADGLIARNPARGVKLPARVPSPAAPPTSEQVRALLDAATPWFRPAVVLGAGLGLRRAEASGFRAAKGDLSPHDSDVSLAVILDLARTMAEGDEFGTLGAELLDEIYPGDAEASGSASGVEMGEATRAGLEEAIVEAPEGSDLFASLQIAYGVCVALGCYLVGRYLGGGGRAGRLMRLAYLGRAGIYALLPRLGELRIGSQGGAKFPGGLVGLAKPRQHHSQRVICIPVRGFGREHRAKRRHRVVIATELRQCGSEGETGFYVIRIDIERMQEAAYCLILGIAAREQPAQAETRLGEIRISAQRRAKLRRRLSGTCGRWRSRSSSTWCGRRCCSS